jgi:pilus assembly protein CpaB
VRNSTIVMIAFAVVFGLLAVFVAQSWLNSQAELRMKSLEANKKPLTTRTIVVAAKPLRFGNELAPAQLREIAWPDSALPKGAFATIKEMLAEGRRVALTAIEPNEPVLASKITGAGQRATLSAMLRDGFKAVTVRVNDVDGVGGFVLPGDHVDVVLTRQVDKTNATTDVVLQNVRVLAIDQIADERVEKPSVVKAVTLEVDAIGAQKVSLSASVGSISLMLRKAGEATTENSRRVTLSDLLGNNVPAVVQRSRFTTVGVRRGTKRDDVSVLVEDADLAMDAQARATQ